MGRPREHDEETRELLVARAGHLLDSGGAAQLTVRRLAEDAGVSTRAIYSLFGGMPGVLEELLRVGAEDMVARHEGVPRQDDAAAEILPLAMAYRAGARARPDSFLLSYGRTGLPFAPPEEVVALLWRCYARVLDAVERALDQRGITGRDPQQITSGLWGTVHGHASLELLGLLGPPRQAEAVLRGTITSLVEANFPGRPRRVRATGAAATSRQRRGAGPRARPGG